VAAGSDISWLSKAVRWTKPADLSLAWWQQHNGTMGKCGCGRHN